MRKQAIIALLLVGAPAARAEGFLGADQGKLLLTAGFSTLEGAGGGALTPWSLIAGYGTSGSWGANAYGTGVVLRDVNLSSFGAAIGGFDRFELSFGHQQLEIIDGPLEKVGVSVDIVGAKVRLFGNAVYGQDSWLPQVAVGAQFKRHGGVENAPVTSVLQLGAKDTEGVDYFVSATKLSLANSFLINATMRATEANQLGLLGFGGDLEDGYSVQFETSIAVLLTRKFAIGGEYRMRPNNLTADDEDAAWDAFVAWAPSKHFSIIGAYANIGGLFAPVTAETSDQDGAYVSVQIGF